MQNDWKKFENCRKIIFSELKIFEKFLDFENFENLQKKKFL